MTLKAPIGPSESAIWLQIYPVQSQVCYGYLTCTRVPDLHPGTWPVWYPDNINMEPQQNLTIFHVRSPSSARFSVLF